MGSYNEIDLYALELIYFDTNTQKTTKTHLKTSGLFRKRLCVFVTSFKRQNDVTPSNTIIDITSDHFSVVNDVKAVRCQNCDFVVSYNTIF